VDHYEGDLSKVNIDPARREEILAKYAKPVVALTAVTAEEVAEAAAPEMVAAAG